LQLSELSNQGFRNLSPDPVSFGAGVTLITGENAQGKTNLLEAVALVCGQRSFRGAPASAMARDGERFSICAAIERRAGEERIRVAWSREKGREFWRGDKPAGFREISSLSPAVFLAPEHRELLTGSPAVRRRFLDRLVLGLKPSAGDDLARYAMALRERNALLARARRGQPMAAGELEAWTEELCVAGSALRRHRRAALSIWERGFRELTRQAGPNYAGIRVDYAAEGDSAEELREVCERLLPLERRRGYSLAGPHRDDLTLCLDNRPLKAFGSQGQQKSFVLALKMAEMENLQNIFSEPPLLLLDDMSSELDARRNSNLMDFLISRDIQVFITTTEPSQALLATAAHCSVFRVENGNLTSEGNETHE